MKPIHQFPLFNLLMIVLLSVLLAACGDNMHVWDADTYADDLTRQLPIPVSDAGSYLGKKITVVGTVQSTYYAEKDQGKPIFLNLDKPYPDNEMVVYLLEEDVQKLAFDRLLYENKQILVRGEIGQYKDEFGKIRPSIHITDASQIAIK
ncbi:MAG: hypothetical protein RI894_375 [Bacteroidota bacterium]